MQQGQFQQMRDFNDCVNLLQSNQKFWHQTEDGRHIMSLCLQTKSSQEI